MSEQIITILKRKLQDLSSFGEVDAETRRNALKEELQYYVLDFIYHHQDYRDWVMYGGSALRIIHGLDRMSVDLDFETSQAVTNKFLEKLKKNIEEYFISTYGAARNFLAIKIDNGRGLLLKFHISEDLSFGQKSNQIHVKIDLNHFTAPKTVTERRPINSNQFSFVILTYNMAALMASKLAAIFLRGVRGVGADVYNEKGRDIYDLLWYMEKKIVPDFDYLIAKGVEVKDPRALFDKLIIKMNKVSDKNLKQDLEPLFIDKTYIKNWLNNWRESYLKLLEKYEIKTLIKLYSIDIRQDFLSSNFFFKFNYKTENGDLAEIGYIISDYWINFRENDLLSVAIDNKINDLVKFDESINKLPSWQQKKLRRYVALFYGKIEKYLEKTHKVLLGGSMRTKIIRMTADNFNTKEEILLNKSALLSCELDDLLE